MPFEFSAKVRRRDLAAIDRFGQDYVNILMDWRPFWRTQGIPAVEDHFTRMFKSRGFGNWASLSAGYRQKKASLKARGAVVPIDGRKAKVKFGPENIGFLTESLFKALTKRNAFGAVARMTPLRMQRGVNGSKIGHAAAFNASREFVVVTLTLEQDVKRRAEEYLLDRLRVAAARSRIVKVRRT